MFSSSMVPPPPIQNPNCVSKPAWFSADLVSYGIIEPGLELGVLPRLDGLGVGPLLEEAPDDGAQRVQVVHPLDDAGCLVQGDHLESN